jgi:antitoxin component YwqK of YwqJK toxin-antitoxin module
MKIIQKLSLIILFCALTFITNGQALRKVETYYDPLTRTRIHEAYTTLTTPPYAPHGVYKEWDQYGNIEKEINYANGKKQGASKIYFGTGAASFMGKELLGKIAFITNYSNDEKNGVEQKFAYKNGRQRVVLQKTWVHSKQVKQEEWDEDGKPTLIATENGLSATFYANGRKATEAYMKDGIEDGKYTEWYENGKLAYTGTLKNKNQVGEATAYFESGIVAKKMNFDPATFKDMHTTQYYHSGKIKWERVGANGHYTVNYYDSLRGHKTQYEQRIDDPNNFNGDLLLDGKQIEYNENGSIKQEVIYDQGVNIAEREKLLQLEEQRKRNEVEREKLRVEEERTAKEEIAKKREKEEHDELLSFLKLRKTKYYDLDSLSKSDLPKIQTDVQKLLYAKIKDLEFNELNINGVLVITSDTSDVVRLNTTKLTSNQSEFLTSVTNASQTLTLPHQTIKGYKVNIMASLTLNIKCTKTIVNFKLKKSEEIVYSKNEPSAGIKLFIARSYRVDPKAQNIGSYTVEHFSGSINGQDYEEAKTLKHKLGVSGIMDLMEK